MRLLFLLLLLGNLAFFAWYHYLRTPLSSAAHIEQIQMSPEKIRIVGAPPAPAAQAAAATAQAVDPQPAAACLSWGPFIGPQDAGNADAMMAEARPPGAQVRRVISDADGHWVLIAPRTTQAEVNQALENLKRLGIAEYNVVTEPAQWRNAISLGIFRTEDAARTLLTEVQNKGVSDVLLERRERFFQQLMFYVRDPDDAAVARLTAMRMRMPGSELKAAACPAP
ncbi:MAG: hypothetical protein FJY56_05705 [Betaproteobacteria bacterium]|nr:hypothetical protein [Betaproteobacteria bacterium]